MAANSPRRCCCCADDTVADEEEQTTERLPPPAGFGALLEKEMKSSSMFLFSCDRNKEMAFWHKISVWVTAESGPFAMER